VPVKFCQLKRQSATESVAIVGGGVIIEIAALTPFVLSPCIVKLACPTTTLPGVKVIVHPLLGATLLQVLAVTVTFPSSAVPVKLAWMFVAVDIVDVLATDIIPDAPPAVS
jgi:hypothetical protein